VTQRGNRRQQTFFSDADYQAYMDLMRHWCGKKGVDIWGYCIMPNHVHLIAVPENKEALRLANGEAHRRYTRMVNFRQGWRGHLWQGRFASYVMQERYLLVCIGYIEMNPVRSGLVDQPEQWCWSGASAHMARKDDSLVNVLPLLDMVGEDWKDFLLKAELDRHGQETLRRHERTGRPLGDTAFIEMLEQETGRRLRPKKSGPNPARRK
jgi:putative transposase